MTNLFILRSNSPGALWQVRETTREAVCSHQRDERLLTEVVSLLLNSIQKENWRSLGLFS